jgi:hypothetical protein
MYLGKASNYLKQYMLRTRMNGRSSVSVGKSKKSKKDRNGIPMSHIVPPPPSYPRGTQPPVVVCVVTFICVFLLCCYIVMPPLSHPCGTQPPIAVCSECSCCSCDIHSHIFVFSFCVAILCRRRCRFFVERSQRVLLCRSFVFSFALFFR